MSPSVIRRIACLALLCVFTSAGGVRADHSFTILVFGDSLSAAYGMASSAGWVALLRERLKARDIEVINRSISGETTAGGAQRLPAALEEVEPDLLVIELGANDGLRGLDAGIIRDNLSRMIEAGRDAGASVLLLGMRIPPNYGPAYTAAFEAVFTDLAAEHDVTLEPFFLAGVAEDWDLMQADGIHPTTAAQPLILEHLWPTLSSLLPGG